MRMNPRPADYFLEQPFGQVPAYRDGEVQLFESGAILIHLGLSDERLLPRGCAVARMRGDRLADRRAEQRRADDLRAGQHRHLQPRPGMDQASAGRRSSRRFEAAAASGWPTALGDKDWLEDRFTIGDLMMVSVLRNLRHTDLVAESANLAAYVARGEARPAFQRALADQLAVFKQNQPEAAEQRRRRASMTYFEGFVVPVPEANKEAYRKHAADAAPMFQEFGVDAPCRGLGQRRAGRQGHRLPQGGRCQAGREGGLLLVRISATRRPATPPTRR